MINIKLEEDKKGNVILKANVDEIHKENRIIKRALFESRVLKNSKEFKYIIPMKYFWPILSNVEKDIIKISDESKIEVLEFSDEYEESYYYSFKATVQYMKKWREEGCPPISRIKIELDNLELEKKVVFERLI